MDLFYAPSEHISSDLLTLTADEYHHAVHVLRKKVGDLLYCIDGNGHCYTTRITAVTKTSLTAKIEHVETQPPPKSHITVAISLTKTNDRFENFLEKATELGVSEIIPMLTARTVSRPREAQYAHKLARWQKIVLAATKQSQRYYLPKVHPITAFEEVLRRTDELRVIPYEFSRQRLTVSFAGKQVLFVIGSEGGFTPEEVEAAHQTGFVEISLGETILRVDTAGIFVIAMVRAEELRQSSA